MKPLFITFEGIEGSGKSTQIKLLKDLLSLRKYDVVLTREPGGGPIGDRIRDLLLNAENQAMDPLCELFLYAAARAQHVSQVILPALKTGKIVLCDRFYDATYAYQASGRGLSPDMIDQIHQAVLADLRPDCTFLLDCDVDTGLKRALGRVAQIKKRQKEDRFEREETVFHQRVRDGYRERARAEATRFHVIDANRDVETIHREIARTVLGILENH